MFLKAVNVLHFLRQRLRQNSMVTSLWVEHTQVGWGLMRIALRWKDGIVKILNLYVILLCTQLYHFFPVSIHYLQCIHCLLYYMWRNIGAQLAAKGVGRQEGGFGQTSIYKVVLAVITNECILIDWVCHWLHFCPIDIATTKFNPIHQCVLFHLLVQKMYNHSPTKVKMNLSNLYNNNLEILIALSIPPNKYRCAKCK